MDSSLEQTLVYHCAPALVGIKPSNLISCDLAQYPDLDLHLEELNTRLNQQGIFFRILCRCENRAMLLVYRRSVLERHLLEVENAAFLFQAGYPVGSLEDTLSHLAQRLALEDFPHESGIFLGYPLADVKGFLRHRGRNCKLCGYWKVYHDPESAQALFQRFDRCRAALCAQVAKGKTISQLFRAA